LDNYTKDFHNDAKGKDVYHLFKCINKANESALAGASIGFLFILKISRHLTHPHTMLLMTRI